MHDRPLPAAEIPAQRDHQQRRMVIVFCLIVFALGFAVFGRALSYGFVAWDDEALIRDNPIVQRMTPSTIGKAFTSYDPELYIPLTFVSYQIDHLLGGGSAAMFHFTNILLHCLNAMLTAWLAFLLLRHRWLAMIVGVLFLLHPLQTEAVVWASGRKDVLSAFFFLIACIAYRLREHDRRLFFLSIVAFLLSLLSKASVLMLPFVLLLLDDWQGRRITGAVIKEKIPYVVLMILFAIIAFAGKQQQVAAGSLLHTVLLAPKGMIFLLLKVLFPFKLSVLYPYTQPVVFSADLVGHLLFLIVLLASVWVLRRKFPALWWGFLFFLIIAAPNFLSFHRGDDLQDIYLASDRFAYLASIGILLALCATVAMVMERMPSLTDHDRKNAVVIILIILLPLMAWKSATQAAVWKDTESLFTNVTQLYPNSQLAHGIVAGSFYEKGNLQAAINSYMASLNIRPTARSFTNIGIVLVDAGQYDVAIEASQEALKLDPTASLAQLNIGVAYVRQSKFLEAAEAFRETIKMDPTAVSAYFNLGVSEEKLGNMDGARKAYEEALRLDPGLEVAREKLAGLGK